MNRADPPQTHKPHVSPQHSHACAHTQRDFGGPCEAAREQPSVSCVCSGAGEGHPARQKESGDPEEGCFVERPRPETERKEQQQNSFPPETHIEEKGEGWGAWVGGLLEQSAAGAIAEAVSVCKCVCREHFLFCVN